MKMLYNLLPSHSLRQVSVPIAIGRLRSHIEPVEICARALKFQFCIIP
jgi:hypothetical protein